MYGIHNKWTENFNLINWKCLQKNVFEKAKKELARSAKRYHQDVWQKCSRFQRNTVSPSNPTSNTVPSTDYYTDEKKRANRSVNMLWCSNCCNFKKCVFIVVVLLLPLVPAIVAENRMKLFCFDGSTFGKRQLESEPEIIRLKKIKYV